ncbi:MAG: signal recognition particle-docking protein FtsY [Bacteroidota bacterium]
MKIFDNKYFEKLKNGLTKTKNNILNKINERISGEVNIDERTLDDIEEALVLSDIGLNTSELIIKIAKQKLFISGNRTAENLKNVIREELKNTLLDNDETYIENLTKNKPVIMLIIGINGSGKTTTIGKLANYLKSKGLKVIVGAADTFRAAADDQLRVWADRVGVDIIFSSSKDPGSVVFDTLVFAKKNNHDIVIIDTAGRLHTQKNLMDQLTKIKSVITKFDDHAPQETLLVIDGNSGQNAVNQVNEFEKYSKIDGIIITKLDGTTKGGTIFNISNTKKIPVRFICIGEAIEDIQIFNPSLFVSAIFDN